MEEIYTYSRLSFIQNYKNIQKKHIQTHLWPLFRVTKNKCSPYDMQRRIKPKSIRTHCIEIYSSKSGKKSIKMKQKNKYL